MNTQIKNIIRRAIDIHMHIGPEAIPRKYTVDELIKNETGNIGGFVLKNHFYPTQPFINATKQNPTLNLFGGIVLNNAIGGLNPEAIRASCLITDKPIMVWLPTINAENFLRQSTHEIAPEWVKKKNFRARLAQEVKPVLIAKNGKITKETMVVLETIKETGSILATGHISWKETEVLVTKARKIGVKKIVVTHPIYQRIAMPINVQKNLAKKGCFIEQSYSMYSIDEIPINEIAKQIKEIGAKSIILSSDVGQTFSDSPSQSLYRFAILLQQEGVSIKELETMLVNNPKKLLSII